ncbi:MAG: phosphate acyltransferase PlsX [Chloroflexi bacterium]|jgi:phosphate acyltransferase|nr:phosphate acyltransferase PlsX [Chloroflexota bacterium]MBT7080326.1 phosphate acyltransferase PlsX [Chloroflexota bacterium]MBT7289375.1 phosphate acyltransferase PlsX [Chloroflexota bacterium]
MSKFKITIDAMGGDYAPSEIIKGAVEGAKELDIEAIIVGLKEPVEVELAKLDTAGLPVSVVEATQQIADGEAPAIAVMRKPNSSVALATRLVKEGKADATLSAGSTGACMVSAFQYLGTLPGIERPVAGGAFFRLAPDTVILDLGANVGCQPYQTVEFAAIGSVYAKTFHGVDNPTIGLLNVGAEEGKGNDFSKEAYNLLKNSGLNFIGNVEGLDIPAGKANVVVTDGFVGNILTKFCEGIGQSMMGWFLKEMKDKLSPEDLQSTANKIYGILSPGMSMGGGPLLGVDGLFGITHGRSKAQQIVGTIKQMKHAWETGFINNLRAELAKIKKTLPDS